MFEALLAATKHEVVREGGKVWGNGFHIVDIRGGTNCFAGVMSFSEGVYKDFLRRHSSLQN